MGYLLNTLSGYPFTTPYYINYNQLMIVEAGEIGQMIKAALI